MNYKKIITIILIIAAIGFGGYYLWKFLSPKIIGVLPGPGEIPTVEVITVGEGGGIGFTGGADITIQEPQIIKQKLSILINSPVFEYWPNSKENSLYFTNPSGQIIRINSDNTRQLVSSQTLNNLHEIKSSNDGSVIIAEFNYPQLPSLSIFFASTTGWQPLPAGTISAAISPDSKKIAYSAPTSLKMLDLTTQKISEIQKISQVGLKLSWLKDYELLLSSYPSIETRNYVYSFNLKNKLLKTLINGEYGLIINWAKGGDSGIKINTVERKARTSLIDNSGNAIANLTFLTMPEKCLIDSQKIYCGIPQNIREGIILPDDYYKKTDYFIDDIFELDLPTGRVSKIFDGNDMPLDAYNLKIKDNNLLFINRYDNKLYALKLD